MALPGSRSAVEKLVEEHYQPLYRYAYRLSGSASDAEDLTQETFCKAQMRLAQLREAGRVKAWLFSILRNAYLQRVRADRTAAAVSLDVIEDLVAPPSEAALPDVGPEQLQQALDELPEDFRTPVILYFFEEFSYREIAGHMDLPIGTVMSRLSRAKAFLRAKLLPPAEKPKKKKDTRLELGRV